MSRRSVRGKGGRTPPADVRRVSFTVTAAEKRRFRAAARALGLSVAELVRRAVGARLGGPNAGRGE